MRGVLWEDVFSRVHVVESSSNLSVRGGKSVVTERKGVGVRGCYGAVYPAGRTDSRD
jgi:hypothetical protein